MQGRKGPCSSQDSKKWRTSVFCGIFATSNSFKGDGNKAQGPVPLSNYKANVVCATAYGASVNLRAHFGVLTQMKNEREWLVTLHCINHRLEHALKDAVNDCKPFNKVDDFSKNVW